jgi:uncharacterized C2H2 Zn-finger protein
MRQAKLDEYTGRRSLVCERCGRDFKSAKGLNVHITKSHASDEIPPLYVGEGIEEIKREGSYVLYCLGKARVRVKNLETTVETNVVRNEEGCLRVKNLGVQIHPDVEDEDRPS